jgi:hypothetical protein
MGVQYDVVERPPRERERVGPEGNQGQANVSVEVRVEEPDGVLAHRAVVVEDELAVPQPAHDLGPILQLRGRHRRYAERPVDRGDAAADAQREPPAGEPMHGRRPRSGYQRMAGVCDWLRRWRSASGWSPRTPPRRATTLHLLDNVAQESLGDPCTRRENT